MINTTMLQNKTRTIPVPRSINVTDVSSKGSHIYTPWYWNFPCVILYLSDSSYLTHQDFVHSYCYSNATINKTRLLAGGGCFAYLQLGIYPLFFLQPPSSKHANFSLAQNIINNPQQPRDKQHGWQRKTQSCSTCLQAQVFN